MIMKYVLIYDEIYLQKHYGYYYLFSDDLVIRIDDERIIGFSKNQKSRRITCLFIPVIIMILFQYLYRIRVLSIQLFFVLSFLFASVSRSNHIRIKNKIMEEIKTQAEIIDMDRNEIKKRVFKKSPIKSFLLQGIPYFVITFPIIVCGLLYLPYIDGSEIINRIISGTMLLLLLWFYIIDHYYLDVLPINYIRLFFRLSKK